MSENQKENSEEIELAARLFTNDLKEYAKITGGLDDLTAKNVYGVLRKDGHPTDYDFLHLHKEASFIFGYECAKPYKREFASMLLGEIELDQDHILRRLQISSANIETWDDNQMDNYIEVATKRFDTSGLTISDELFDFLNAMNELINKEAKDGE